MTRLRKEDIETIAQGLRAYDNRLRLVTGRSLRELAGQAAGLNENDAAARVTGCRVCAVPMTCGQGVIASFAETVGAIASHLGFDAFVADHPDMAGIADAYDRRADIIISSDDHRFVAIHLGNRQVVDNNRSTGKGFSTGLSCMVGGFKSKPVLVIGCGPVGRSAARHAARLGAAVTIYDTVTEQCRHFIEKWRPPFDIFVSKNLTEAMGSHDLIIEATPASNTISSEAVRSTTMIAAPGVPCGVSPKARELLAERLLWDPLQIGVATMLMESIV